MSAAPLLQGVTPDRPVGDEVTLSLRTVHLGCTRRLRPRTEGNVWPVTISKSVFLGDLTQIHVNWAVTPSPSSASRSHIATPRTNRPF